MKKATILVFLTFLLLQIFQAPAKSQSVKNVDYYFEYPNVIITYDLIDADPEATFTIKATAETSAGRTFPIENGKGAIGEGIKPGKKNQIIWNIARNVTDIKTGEKFAFDVTATREEKAEKNKQVAENVPEEKQDVKDATPDKTETEEEKTEQKTQPDKTEDKPAKKEEKKEEEPKQQDERDYTQAELQQQWNELDPPGGFGSLVLSTVWPGWGASRYKENSNAGWWGLLGWSAVGGYIYFHNQAQSYYEEYASSMDPQDRPDYYADAQSANSMSMNFVYGAAAVWGIEYIRVLIRSSRAQKNAERKRMELKEKYPDMDFGYFYNPVNGHASVGLKIRF